MIVSTEYIKAYVDKAKAEAKAKAAAIAGVERSALERFTESCRTWLGDLWDEFDPGEPVLQWDGEVFKMTLPIIWNEVEGGIFSGWIGHGAYRPSDRNKPFIWFEIKRCYSSGYNNPKNWKGKVDLQFEEFVEEGGVKITRAQPVDPLEMGELLAKTYQAKKTSDEALEQLRAEDQERQIARLEADFGYRHDPQAVSKHLAECLEKYPELEEKWQVLANKRSQHLLKEQQEEAEKKAEWDRIEAERQAEHERLMEKKAALFRPFTIYKVVYGARMDGEEDWYTQDVHTIAPDPDESGWWTVPDHGQIKRMKLMNVLSVEEIRVESEDDIPWGISEPAWLRSEKFDDVSVNYRVVPEALFDR
jgi:hypothetical protein